MLLCSPVFSSGFSGEIYEFRDRSCNSMSDTESPLVSPLSSSKFSQHFHTAYHNRSVYNSGYNSSLPRHQQLSPASTSSTPNGLHIPFSSPQERWQSSISYTATPDIPPESLPDLVYPAQNTTTTPVATTSWPTPGILDTTTWNYAPSLESFADPTDVSNLTSWHAVDHSGTTWAPPILPGQPLPDNTISTETSYQYAPLYSYKQQASVPVSTFANLGLTPAISGAAVYPTAAQILATPIHPAFQQSSMSNIDTLRQSISSDMADIEEEILSSAAAKQALSMVNSRSQSRSDPCSHAHSHAAISKTKTAPKGGRVGPLTVSQREKVEDMRNYGACWRCRKYKKPCNGPGVCNTCVTSGFRVWPSALGCRRGDFDSFAFGMIPTHAEQIVGQMVACYPKPPGWRNISKVYCSELTLPASAANGDRFEQLMLKVQNTELTGPGVMELLQIACNLQRGLPKESRVLANTLKGLGHACEFYSCFVATAESASVLRSKYDVVNIFTQNRKALLTTLSSFLNSCLTGKMRDWLPTFLSANFIIFTFVMLSDAAVMVPVQYRDKLWTSVQAVIMDFRGILYPMAQDLLSALGKGSKLLHMQCWNLVPVSSEDSDQDAATERNKEGLKILDGDVASFDGLRALQLWLDRFGPLMRGDAWYANAPHTVEVLPICSWERMFDFSPRG